MLVAMADAMLAKGFVGTTVADVIKGAGVSRETFYRQFDSKLDCFMAAFELAVDALFANLDEVGPLVGDSGGDSFGDSSDARIAGFDAVLATYLATLAADPGLSRLFLVEVYAAGPEAIERRARAQHRIAERLAELLDLQSPADRFACDAVVAAVATLVTAPLVRGDTEALLALREPIVALVARLLP